MNKKNEYTKLIETVTTDWAIDHNIFGTLKFVDGTQTSDERAIRAIKRFWITMDRFWWGASGVKSGQRLSRVVWQHRGVTGSNIHYHFTVKAGSAFITRAERAWRDADVFACDAQIELISNHAAAVIYGAHEYQKLGSEVLHAETTQTVICADNSKYKMSRLKRALIFGDQLVT